MGKKMGRKQGFKRPKTPESKETRRGAKKIKHPQIEEKSEEILPGDTHQEQFGDDSGLRKEPSAYDNLLMSLKSGSNLHSDSYNDSESLEGIDDDFLIDEAMENELPQQTMASDLKEHEGFEVDDYSQSFDSIPDNELEVHSNHDYSVDKPVYMRSFDAHFRYTLSKEDIDHLLKNKSKYKWEMPALETSNCKWLGTGECFMEDDNVDPEYGLKPSLYEHWINIYKASGCDDFHSSKERIFFTLCSRYWDILHCNKKPFYQKGRGEDSSIMDAYLMHCLNHIYKTGDLVRKNDAKAKDEKNFEEMGDCIRDQGFTRPKVLMLLPLRSIAFRVMTRLIQLIPPTRKVNVDHMDRFNDDFGIEDGADDDEKGVPGGELGTTQKSSKPSDFLALFNGNSDDHFMIGVKFTRKSVILYNDFYTSDMIIASPLGLITKIGETQSEKEKDVNYLSSIEILIVDHADVIALQNWSHVSTVVEQLNRVPSNLGGTSREKENLHRTDIRRIKDWYLNGHAKFYRQSIILSYYANPDINALFNHHFVNYKGKVKLLCEYNGVLPKVLPQVRQIYERFNADTIQSADDARLEYFAKKVFPKLKDSIQGGIMLFISSYFEFVRVRNFLKSQNASFCLIGDYTKQSDISRSRVWFFEGKKKIMLYTERAHFYHRYKIRGMQNLIIYSLPERKEFYPEIVNMLEVSPDLTCSVLFSRFDRLRLERIVGTRPAKKMLTSDKSVFVFC